MNKLGIYLAYAIDQDGKGDQGLLSLLSTSKDVAWIYNPGEAFLASREIDDITPAITKINREALHQADVVVALLPAGQVTIGVPMEIEAAQQAGKPVVIISDAPSWALETGNPLTYRATHESVLEILSEVRETYAVQEQFPTEIVPVVLEGGAEIPRRAYPDDAGYDLVVQESVEVPPGGFADIHCGVSAQLPEWSWGLITGRSSTLRNKGLLVAQGVIDAGYRGELFAGVWNLTDELVRVSKGERVAQLIIMVNGTLNTRMSPADYLDPSPRGANGFGSSGK